MTVLRTAELRFFPVVCLQGGAPVNTEPGDQAAAGATSRGSFLASHTDREQAVDTLKAAFVEGRLTKDELDERAGQAFAARTYADLAVLTADIPAGPTGARLARAPASKKAITLRLAACAILMPVVIVAAAIIFNNDGVALALGPLLFTYLLASLIGVSHLVGKRLERRRTGWSSGQLPPGPGPGGQVLEEGQRGRAVHDPAPPGTDQTQADLRTDNSRRERPSALREVRARRGIRPVPGVVLGQPRLSGRFLAT